ncbi:MAG: leucyl/phenylalanyl-tRNA--protein transferase [Myxococcales bacterium]|nr:leucyl/phenylalanyl-tRNA--protein transferase [Myxococcales bacterium]
MPIYMLDATLSFPDPRRTGPSGILAVGGDLSPERLMLGYSMSIFPWYSVDDPILWHSPMCRFVLYPLDLHVGRTVEKWLRRGTYEVRFDTAFDAVIDACGDTPRPGSSGTWLTPEMRAAYKRLHQLGHAHCAEAWLGDRLVGGLYGVVKGSVFFGESMFSLADNASKVAFATLARALFASGYALIDSQVYTENLAAFGAVEITRLAYLGELAQHVGVSVESVWPVSAP